jgi:hypothetical protein
MGGVIAHAQTTATGRLAKPKVQRETLRHPKSIPHGRWRHQWPLATLLVRAQCAAHKGGSVCKAMARGSPTSWASVFTGCAHIAGKLPKTRQSLRALCRPKPGVSSNRKAHGQCACEGEEKAICHLEANGLPD